MKVERLCRRQAARRRMRYEMVSEVLLNGRKVHDIEYERKETGECCSE